MTSITFRCDEQTVSLLDSLALQGENRSDTIRRALHDAARLRRREQMRSQSALIAADEEDRLEIQATRAQLDQIRAW